MASRSLLACVALSVHSSRRFGLCGAVVVGLSLSAWADPTIFDQPWAAQALTNAPSVGELRPMFSPDGSRIVYWGMYVPNERAEIEQVDSVSGSIIPMPTVVAGGTPSYTSDKTGITGILYYRGQNPGDAPDIWKANLDGSGQLPLWSQDGNEQVPNQLPLPDRRIIYQHHYPMDIWLATPNANESEWTCSILYGSSKGDRQQPRVSSDGQYATYNSQAADGTPYDIFRCDIETGIETQLTFDAAQQGYPSFSPDRKWIVYQSKEDGGPYFDIWVTDAATGAKRYQLTNDTTDSLYPQFDPAHPDGSRIVYSRGPWGESPNTDLWQLNAVPEPFSMAFMASAFVGVIAYRLRRRSRGTGQG